ncbi:arylesterase [Mesoterricola silvestris]|uniref:Arylesterase n=1 Tax=Mesoterricola silvestris TaxID=2927979 RepID=A0AA48GQ83_9BACT|nr:arylesterase [Mesoterricola silvestris]BDU72002.1 arylesterase [Mesoterricola silvestris]
MRAVAPLATLAALAAPVQAQPTLVFLGDSLTAGLGLDRSQAFPSLIEARLRKAGLAWKVVNAGVSGDTTAGARARLDWIYRSRVEVMFVCVGSNDGLRGLPPAEAERNLRAILDRARREGTRVVLAGAMVPDNYGRAYQEAFGRIFPRLAREYKLPFLPFLLEGVALRPELNQEDGIHPNAEGARRVADSVWKVLEPQLRAAPPASR